MNAVKIYDVDTGDQRIQVFSYGNGLAYNILFGGAGNPMNNIFFQGDDALMLREELENIEEEHPEADIRQILLFLLDPYLM